MKLKNHKLRNLFAKYSGIIAILLISVFFLASSLLENESKSKSSKFISPEWNQFPTVSLQDSSTQGTPVDLGPGITITVDEIMQSEAMLPADYYSKPRHKTNPEFEIEKPEKQINPNAPDASQWPPLNENDRKQQEQQQTDNPQTVGTSFLGQNISASSGYIPPDSQGDVGPTQVMTITNGRVRIYSKAGVLGGLNADLDVFFLSVAGASGVSDPHVRYDRLTGRWFIVGINLQAAPNLVVLAVSSGSTITNSSSFTFYSFAENTGGATSGFGDYPTLGVDNSALYIGMNIFNAAGTALLGTNGYVVRKSNLISGTLTVTSFNLMVGGSGAGIITPQGVDNDDPSSTEGYFIGVDNAAFSLLVMKRISNPGSTPSVSGNLNITVPTTVYPETVPANGSSIRLDGLDDRLFAAEIHRDKISNRVTLWTSHNIEVNASGVASATGSRDAGRWYEITNLTTTPVLRQSGTLFDPTATNPRYYWIPSVAMSGQGHMAMGVSSAGLLKRAEVYTAGRLRDNALGTIQASVLAQSSSTAYNVESGVSSQRWGDYSQTVVDPNDDMTMWTFQEYCDATNSWGVRAIQLKAPAPATPFSSSVANINTGLASVNIIITGTSVSGTEFFDPGADAGGPGFLNHITASISGGVIVNSVTFTDPIHVTLNISTVSATAGLKNITITNPDGQSATGNNLINIISAPPVLSLTAFIQGFYDASANAMVRDTARVYLRNNTSPYAVVDSGKVYLTTSGTASITYNNAVNGVNYYFQVKHRNTMETWSKSPGSSFVSSALSYDFTSAATQAFGNNMILIDAAPVAFGLYGGDVDQDGIIDASDVSTVDNGAFSSLSGYVLSDLTGDDFVDATDVSIVDNNANNSVALIRP